MTMNGIGVTTAIFSIVEGVLLRPLPYPASERIAILGDVLEGSLCASYTHATVTAPTSATICVTPRALLTLAGISRPTLNYPVAAIREGECDADEQRGLYRLGRCQAFTG
jgi:hypothetical protein